MDAPSFLISVFVVYALYYGAILAYDRFNLQSRARPSSYQQVYHLDSREAPFLENKITGHIDYRDFTKDSPASLLQTEIGEEQDSDLDLAPISDADIESSDEYLHTYLKDQEGK